MNIALLRQPVSSVQVQWLVLGIFEDDAEPPTASRGTALEPIITRLIGDKDLTGSLGELTALHGLPGLEAGAVLLVGLGPRAAFRPGRGVLGGICLCQAACRQASRWQSPWFCLPTDDPPVFASALIEGAVAGTAWPGGAQDRSGPACF